MLQTLQPSDGRLAQTGLPIVQAALWAVNFANSSGQCQLLRLVRDAGSPWEVCKPVGTCGVNNPGDSSLGMLQREQGAQAPEAQPDQGVEETGTSGSGSGDMSGAARPVGAGLLTTLCWHARVGRCRKSPVLCVHCRR